MRNKGNSPKRKWSERQDSNLRRLAPKASALARLSYAPTKGGQYSPLRLVVQPPSSETSALEDLCLRRKQRFDRLQQFFRLKRLGQEQFVWLQINLPSHLVRIVARHQNCLNPGIHCANFPHEFSSA